MNEETPVTEPEVQAYADGRLAAGRRAAVEAWLAARPDEAESIAAYRRVMASLHAAFNPLLDEPVPQRLERAPRLRQRWRRFAVAAGWLVLGIAIGTVGGWQLHERRPAASSADVGPLMARRAAVAHATYAPEVRRPVEVGADQEQQLVAWLSKRLGVQIRAPRLAEAGLSLVGGRLLPGESGPVGLFMYEAASGKRVTVYLWAETHAARDTAFRYARESNVHVFYWLDRESSFAVASADLDAEELRRVAALVYRQS
jgi:anti-sigma factor RsiW